MTTPTDRHASAPTEKEKHLRSLIRRAYKAYYKEDYEEGECWNEVSEDLRWEGIDGYDAQELFGDPDDPD